MSIVDDVRIKQDWGPEGYSFEVLKEQTLGEYVDSGIADYLIRSHDKTIRSKAVKKELITNIKITPKATYSLNDLAFENVVLFVDEDDSNVL